MSSINVYTHRFLDCDQFPAGAGHKVKEKMVTYRLQSVTCPCCKSRIVEHLLHRDWNDLAQVELQALELSVVDLTSYTIKAGK